MDRFDAMLAFTRVVELNSFTQAASSLNMPKATLSAQVAALEKHLNVKLLHRTTRKVSVTNDGAAYYERVVRLLQDLEETETSVTQSRMAYRGRLRVDVATTIGRRIILPALDDFITRYPEIELELGCTDRTVNLLQEGVDCAIRGGMPIDESLVARKLIATSRITCATPIYLERHGIPKSLAELELHSVVNYQSPRTAKVMPFYYEIDNEMVAVQGRRKLAINDIDSCVNAVLANIGIAQLPYFGVRDYITNGQLIQILPEFHSETTPLYIVYLQNRHLSANVRAFVDWVLALFKAEQEGYLKCCKNV